MDRSTVSGFSMVTLPRKGPARASEARRHPIKSQPVFSLTASYASRTSLSTYLFRLPWGPRVGRELVRSGAALESIRAAVSTLGPSEVLVSFDYNVDGIVRVTARDRRTGKQANIKITGLKDRLSEEEKTEARAALEASPQAESDTIAVLRDRAESLLSGLRETGREDDAEELEGLLAELDAAEPTGADSAAVERLVEWIYEHEE